MLLAVKNSENDIVELLLNKRKNINIEARNKEGDDTPLLLAVKLGRLTIVELLLNRGAKIEAKDNDNDTPLLLAVKLNL